MARGEKTGFIVEQGLAGSLTILNAIFNPSTVYVRVTYRISSATPTIKSESTEVTFTNVGGGIEFNRIALEDVIPADAHIRAIEFLYTTSDTAPFFQLNLAENGTTDIIVFEEQGILYFEKVRITVGGN